jgi:acetylornithine/N-succinyldiaminopimelate aminotransferase
LDILGQAGFMQQVVENAGYLKQELEKIVDPRIVELRGKGFMLGIEFNCEVKELIEICRQQGLLLLGAGPRVLRLVPPLTVSKDEIDQATIFFASENVIPFNYIIQRSPMSNQEVGIYFTSLNQLY